MLPYSPTASAAGLISARTCGSPREPWLPPVRKSNCRARSTDPATRRATRTARAAHPANIRLCRDAGFRPPLRGHRQAHCRHRRLNQQGHDGQLQTSRQGAM